MNMMRAIEFDFSNSGFPAKEIEATASRLGRRISELRSIAASDSYSDQASSLALPREKKFAEACRKMAERHRDASAIIVVGIGGSNLGTRAVHEAVLGKFHNIDSRRSILYADTVDADSVLKIAELARRHADTGSHGKILLNVVSKSGDTIETIANLEALLGRLGKDCDVVVTSDEGSRFSELARKAGMETLPIPPQVGGRYSVFSCVGLFPLALLGIDIRELLAGARDALTTCLSEDEPAENPAAAMASLIFLHRKKGRLVHNQFLFSNDFERVGGWYRQLLAESIGKVWDARHARKIKYGILPTVSIGTTDLHSMAQLYLSTDDTFFRFVRIANGGDLRLPVKPALPGLGKSLGGRGLREIMDILADSTEETFAANGKPFAKFVLKDKSPYSIGQLLQMEMAETMLLAELFGVNPFDQPEVEKYKKVARRKLGATAGARATGIAAAGRRQGFRST